MLWYNIKSIRIADVLDIAIITFVFYKLILMIRGKTAARIVRAVVVLLLITWLSQVLGLNVINFILTNTIKMGVIALLIMFQPEIRRALERIGASSSIGRLLGRATPREDAEVEVDQVVDACQWLARSKFGALIVFERDNNLEDYMKTGTMINADLSSELLRNIFFPKAALHDGAVIIRDGRILAAGCMLPMTDNTNLERDLGMRHRAGIGISEQTDAIVVIVSEERGTVSVAENGMIKMNLSADVLKRLLLMRLVTDDEKGEEGRFRIFRRKNDAE
ncbi:MAG: diadenylate cyclase CdaA [Oscillospiraceae bacterium]|nr:diadenylate cyclase CdaA [Oscillospiraceae bacterium]